MDFYHKPVLLQEVIDGLNLNKSGIYVDCTLGGGGHAYEILKNTAPGGMLIGLDQDVEALEFAKERLCEFKDRVIIKKSNFSKLKEVINELKINAVDGILFDLGVSSYQLDSPKRGFSYKYDALLDMRMDPENSCTAKHLVNTLSQSELCDIISKYGEERWAKRIAEFIVKERLKKPIDTTLELVEIIKKAIPAAARRRGHHPAKRTFQALRIAVNDELNVIKTALEQAVDLLKSKGRLCVITFHSLEDRIVKEFLKEMSSSCKCPKELPVCICNKEQKLKIVNKKPITPSKRELMENPRSRSAKLRIAEKL